MLCVVIASVTMSPAAAADLADTVAHVKPSIVAIGAYQKLRSPPFRYLGTGFVIGNGRTVATNAHVVRALDSTKQEILVAVTGTARDAQPRKATVVGTEADTDLALLELEGAPLPPLPLRAPDDLREGESLAFTGFPIGNVLGFYPVTHRATLAAISPIVIPQARASQLDATVVKRLSSEPLLVYQLDATAYPGNSGSPLYDVASGEVVGVINMVFVKGSKEHALAEPSGITYAIPVRHLRELLKKQRN